MNDSCIICTAGKGNKQGYHKVWWRGKSVWAHRLAYCRHNDVDMDSIVGLEIRHTCDNPHCINGAHLLLGTHWDNMKDRQARKRTRNGYTGPIR